MYFTARYGEVSITYEGQRSAHHSVVWGSVKRTNHIAQCLPHTECLWVSCDH